MSQFVINDTDSSADYHREYISSFKATLWEPATLKKEFSKGGRQEKSMFALAMSQLPKTISSSEDQATYDAFIDAFGTHYVSQSVMGGCVDAWLTARNSFIDKEKYVTWMKENSFGINLIEFAMSWSQGNNVGNNNTRVLQHYRQVCSRYYCLPLFLSVHACVLINSVLTYNACVLRHKLFQNFNFEGV